MGRGKRVEEEENEEGEEDNNKNNLMGSLTSAILAP